MVLKNFSKLSPEKNNGQLSPSGLKHWFGAGPRRGVAGVPRAFPPTCGHRHQPHPGLCPDPSPSRPRGDSFVCMISLMFCSHSPHSRSSPSTFTFKKTYPPLFGNTPPPPPLRPFVPATPAPPGLRMRTPVAARRCGFANHMITRRNPRHHKQTPIHKPPLTTSQHHNIDTQL